MAPGRMHRELDALQAAPDAGTGTLSSRLCRRGDPLRSSSYDRAHAADDQGKTAQSSHAQTLDATLHAVDLRCDGDLRPPVTNQTAAPTPPQPTRERRGHLLVLRPCGDGSCQRRVPTTRSCPYRRDRASPGSDGEGSPDVGSNRRIPPAAGRIHNLAVGSADNPRSPRRRGATAATSRERSGEAVVDPLELDGARLEAELLLRARRGGPAQPFTKTGVVDERLESFGQRLDVALGHQQPVSP